MNLPTKTIEDIRKISLCYDPDRYLPEDWTGTALDILRVDECPAKDRLWVVLNEGWIDDRTLRLFAVWCAREALKLIDDPDARSVAACDVAERYANGGAGDDELAAAWDAARAAARDVARDVARAAAWDAAWAAARDAASAAARDVARAAARAAASAAAWVAAWAAAWDAAWAAARDVARAAAWDAAWAAARDVARVAARDAQVEQLIKMLEG